MNLPEFFDRFGTGLAAAVARALPPLYDAETRHSGQFDLRRLRRRPLGGQADAIRATALSLQRHPGTLVVGEMGVGKLQPLDAKILTPTGWIRMGNVRVGDDLIRPDGGTSRVVGVFPQGKKSIYRVTFSDGSSTECGLEHNWLVNTPLRKWRGRPGRVQTLRQILGKGLSHGNGNYQHFVPMVAPIEFRSTCELAVDPYVLGVLLGDGGLSQRQIKFTTTDQHIVDAVAASLEPGAQLKEAGRYGYVVTGAKRFRAALTALGILGTRAETKFVPPPYLHASVTARVSLLQGLFDTDASVSGHRGTCVEFITVSPQLACDVVELVQSLGGVARRTEKIPTYTYQGERRVGQRAYRIRISLPANIIPFQLTRKLDIYYPHTKYQPTRAIVRVEPVGTRLAQCILVDSPDQLYITDDYIVTHNTTVAAAAAFLAGHRNVIVICPPHLVRKWQREITQTVPGARATIVRTLTDLEHSRQLEGSVRFVICSREQAKLGYRWQPAVIARLARDRDGRLGRDEAGAIVRALCCSTCFAPIRDDEDVPLSWTDLTTKRQRCKSCGGALWQADRTGPRRFPLADYVRRRMAGHFDLLIADEVHEFKARASAQGLAAGSLASACGSTLTLTGTLFGGYSSTLFYLLHRFSPAIRAEFGYHDEAKWVSRYGIVERITKKDPEAYTEDGRQTKRRGYLTRTVERPGIVPAILYHLIGNTVFLRLADVARNLPPYTERVALYALDPGTGPSAQSQANCYERLASDLRQAVLAALHEGSKRLLGTYLQALLAYPDGCTRGETVRDPRTGAILASVPPLPEDVLYPKEQALLELAHRERARGRRVWIYVTHTESRDLTPRLRAILEGAGVRVAVLKAGTISADRREEWVAARVREGVDVVLSHPRLVQTGLDLLDFPSLVWYEPDYSVYTVRQASRRSWRIGQHQPVEVTFLIYEQTLQADALGLIAAKVRSALTIEGELPEDGLAALDGENHDIFLALARRLTEPSGAQDQSLEELFAAVQRVEAEADDLLVEDDWVDGATSGLAAGPERSLPPHDIVDSWHSVFDRPTEGIPESDQKRVNSPVARIVTLEDLARLVRRPMQQRKAVPSNQLDLFEC